MVVLLDGTERHTKELSMIICESAARLEPKDCKLVKGTLRQIYDITLNGKWLSSIHIGNQASIERFDWLTGKNQYIFGTISNIDRTTNHLTISDDSTTETMSVDDYIEVLFGS